MELKEFLNKLVYACGISFITIILLFGIFYFFPISTMKAINSFPSLYIGSSLTYLANRNSETLRTIGLAITEKCIADPCRAITIFDELQERKKYLLTANHNSIIQDPIYTFQTGSGDCKSYATLFTALYNNLGGNSEIRCIPNHCYNIVHYQDNTSTIVDITNNIITSDINFYQQMYLE